MFDLPPLPPNATRLSLALPHKPSAPLICTFIPGFLPVLIVYLNGLGLPQSHWNPSITHYLSCRTSVLTSDDGNNNNQNNEKSHHHYNHHPSILTYDRYGQGLSVVPDPQDSLRPDLPPGHRHDLVSVTNDLHELIILICNEHLHSPSSSIPLMFVANSIGCTIARYFAYQHPGSVAALLLLDSYMTDTDFVSLYPDPDAPGFKEGDLPDGITTEDIRAARDGMGRLLSPSVVNKEGFWRGNISELIGKANTPRLVGWKGKNEDEGKGPWLTVAGHDWDVFAEESLRMKGMTRAVCMNYTNPAWGRYNEGLLNITSEDRRMGDGKVVIAEGAGHFIQQMRPDFVGEEVDKLVVKVMEDIEIEI